MKKEDIDPSDWQRVLFGEAPVEFLVEVLIRTSVVYVALIVVVRLMGKRMSGQLTISELAVMVTLGAIVSPAMQIPQLGILQGIMVLICALLFQKGIHFFEFRSVKFEEMSQGKVSTLIEDGVLQLMNMDEARISKQQLYCELRNQNIFNLGEVRRVYLEACGTFSIYKRQQPVAGLSVFPPADQHITGFGERLFVDKQVCRSCGNVVNHDGKYHVCPVCNAKDWDQASISIT